MEKQNRPVQQIFNKAPYNPSKSYDFKVKNCPYAHTIMEIYEFLKSEKKENIFR